MLYSSQPPPPAFRPFPWRGDDFVAFSDTSHKEDDPDRNPFGGRFVRLFSSAPRDGERGGVARGLRYRERCRLCRSDAAFFLPGTPRREVARRWRRINVGLAIGSSPLGCMVSRPSRDVAAHQLCMDYASRKFDKFIVCSRKKGQVAH